MDAGQIEPGAKTMHECVMALNVLHLGSING